ncbi:MAG TPA: efflux RND transporter periplasmic adaptor subunit [Anaeromyxobacteraceae bacterium]|nr:efflux RND transporter periplasmic adaptor subunit [Anaeromyxobacteraceae bacterium]
MNEPASTPPAAPAKGSGPGRRVSVPLVLVIVAVAVVAAIFLLYRRSASRVSTVALAAAPRTVTTAAARAGSYRQVSRYIATIEPWVEARVGPQLVSAYVDEVLVRPGAVVKRGQVIARLDCRNASEESKAIAAQARAVEARHQAVAHEAARVGELLGGGFVSPNEAEQKAAESASKEAELQGSRARLARSALEVDDCVLRAPFDGEIGARAMDPGAFARPGAWIVSVIDRSTVRVVLDVPEPDFASVAPGTPVKLAILATGASVDARVARRSPAADRSTRTIHVEVDVPDPARRLPVYTTAEVAVAAAQAVSATGIPLPAATVRGGKASVVVVDKGLARRTTYAVLGEDQGTLYVDPSLAAGSLVVTEGRSGLKDGEPVTATTPAAASGPAAPTGPASPTPPPAHP